MNDEIAELADRLRAKLRRGEEPGLEFEIEFASLTDDERDEFLVLFDQRASHGEESSEDSPRTSGSCARFSTYWSPAARRPARRWGRLSRPATSACWRSSRRPARCLTRWLTRCVRPRPTGRTARGEESAPRCSCSGRPAPRRRRNRGRADRRIPRRGKPRSETLHSYARSAA